MCIRDSSTTLDKPICNVPTDPTNPDTIPSDCGLIVALQSMDVSCFGANDGSITANVISGVAPFIYRWNTGASTPTIGNLAADTYWLEVVDADDCRQNFVVRVNSHDRLVVSETRTVLDCERLEIKLNVTGGQGGPYRWQCEGLTGSLLDPINLPAGTYSCLITDGAGCTVSHVLEIEDYQALAVTGVVKNTTCGQKDGGIDLNTTGGTAPYTFVWDNGLSSEEDQLNLESGTYNVTVTDATNCTTTRTYTIEDCGGEGFGFIGVTAFSLGDLSVQVEWETVNEEMEGNYIVLHSTDGENYDALGNVMESKGPIAAANYEFKELSLIHI